MADVPTSLLSAMDSALPEEPEDYTDWELDEETRERLARHEEEDTNTAEGWALFTSETWED